MILSMIAGLSFLSLSHAAPVKVAAAYQTVVFNPLTFTMIDLGGAGDTVAVMFVDPYGNPCPMVDAAGVNQTSVTVTLSAGQTTGIAALLLATKPDGTNLIVKLPKNVAQLRAAVLSGTANIRTVGWGLGGTPDGSAGLAGSGCNYLPNASVPDGWFVLDSGKVMN